MLLIVIMIADKCPLKLCFTSDPCQLVLSGAASYFRGKWKEFKDSRSEVQCSTEVARSLVRFFYTGRLEDGSLDGREETFLRLADFYQVHDY